MNNNNKTPSKASWGSWLRPHTAMIEPPKTQEMIVGLAVVPPEQWPADQRTLFGTIERTLLSNPLFRHLSVLPVGCLRVAVRQVAVPVKKKKAPRIHQFLPA